MKLSWKKHAEERFLERVLKYNFMYGELDSVILHQRVRIPQGYDRKYGTDKYKVIEKVNDIMVTIEKAEYKDRIHVITLWEANKKEVEIWENHQTK